MLKTFKYGDYVEWNSKTGKVGGVIVKKMTSDVRMIRVISTIHR